MMEVLFYNVMSMVLENIFYLAIVTLMAHENIQYYRIIKLIEN